MDYVLRYGDLSERGIDYTVGLSTPDPLPPVTLMVGPTVGGFHFQGYLTPEGAEKLASALIAAASTARDAVATEVPA